MRTKYEILLRLLFPQYSHPTQSRFIKTFQIIKNKQIKNRNYVSFTISFEKIENGEDKRTSIIIKNIPNSINKDYINEILKGVGNINFLYLPYDKYNKKNLGIVYVNMVNYRSIILLYNKLKGYKFDNFDLKKPIEIYYSKIQGKEGLSKMFRNNKFIK